MKKLLLVCFALVLGSAALAGCRAEGEIGDAASNVAAGAR